MSQSQIVFLTLVFVATFVVVIWLFGRTTGSATGRRLKQMGEQAPGDGAANGTARWVERVNRATKPLARLSVPEAGYETSALRRRFMNAGIRQASATMAYFGLKTALALGLPMLAFAALALTRSPLSGLQLLMVLLAGSAFGYYLPNYVLA